MNIFKRIFSKRSNRACSIGIIGGADGPTCIFAANKNTLSYPEGQTFLKNIKSKLTANCRTVYELEKHLIANYNAVPVCLPKKREELFKANVIMNKFRQVLVLPEPLGAKPTKRQLLKYLQNDTSFEQARNYPSEELDLDIKAYILPFSSADECEAVVELEMTSGYISITGAAKEVIDDLIIWYGISEEDIANETQRFAAYAYTLREQGYFKP